MLFYMVIWCGKWILEYIFLIKKVMRYSTSLLYCALKFSNQNPPPFSRFPAFLSSPKSPAPEAGAASTKKHRLFLTDAMWQFKYWNCCIQNSFLPIQSFIKEMGFHRTVFTQAGCSFLFLLPTGHKDTSYHPHHGAPTSGQKSSSYSSSIPH